MEFKMWILPEVEFIEFNKKTNQYETKIETVSVLHWETDKDNNILAWVVRPDKQFLQRTQKVFNQPWFLRNIKEVTVEVKENIISPIVQNGPYR